MSTDRDRSIIIELVVRTGHPALLDGLEAWLELGLISDGFVRQLAQAEFVCPLPEVAAIAAETSPAPVADQSAPVPVPQPVATRRSERPARPNFLARTLQALMAEVSVVWLLFLGVFLVVVSSGVLAATQWQNVPPLGQYSILLGYTVAFGVASGWTRRQAALQLTSQMLAIATLLLIPVNFWMMDGFRLWQGVSGLGLMAIATVSLSGIAIALLQPARSPLISATVLLLSGLHWGWSQAGWPWLAAYIGTVAATGVLLWQDSHRPAALFPASTPSTSPDSQSSAIASIPLATLAIALSALLLIGRALFVVQVPISQLGLAIGLCGWLLGWLARRDRTRWGWQRAGTFVLFLAWAVTVAEVPPWQAIAISGLGGWLLLDHLWRTGQSVLLAASFGVGWQLLWLLWRCLPEPLRSQIVQWWIQQAGDTAMPLALLGLGFFPYVMGLVGFAGYLRRQQRLALAQDADRLALAAGGLLVAISWANPLVRSLTLTLALLTLTRVTRQRREHAAWFVYLTHSTALATLLSWIHATVPTLNPNLWAAMLLAIAAAEWLYCAANTGPSAGASWTRWTRSSWHFGLLAAAASYQMMWDLSWPLAAGWKLGWLVLPALLTGLGYRDRFPNANAAVKLSAIALLVLQPLLLDTTAIRLSSMGIATGLMLLNTHRLRHLLMAALTVGFGLGCWLLALYETGQSWLPSGWFLPAIAATIALLWAIHNALQRRQVAWSPLYQRAIAAWAQTLFLGMVILLSIGQLLFYVGFDAPETQMSIAAAAWLVVAAVCWTWQQPTVWAWIAIATSAELLGISSLVLVGRSLTYLAIANLGLAWGSLLAAEAWVWATTRRPPDRATNPGPTPEFPHLPTWNWLALSYAVIGVWLAHHSFTATTGLYTLTGAGVAIGVGRRPPFAKPKLYLGLMGLSIAAYEWLIYRLLQSTGGQPGDGVVLLALLAVAFAMGYRLLPQPVERFLPLTQTNRQDLAHGHWLLGTGFGIAAPWFTLSRTGHWIWMAIALLLSAYALFTGHRAVRSKQTPLASSITPTLWTYAGIWQWFAAIAAGLWLLIPHGVLVDWAGAIATTLALLLYPIPWARLGWEIRPWRRSAGFLPGFVVGLTGWGTNLQTILIVAAFYAWFASRERLIRSSYISVLLANWALVRLLQIFQLTQPLWYAAIFGGSVLYLAQVDPALQAQQRREQRHWLRCLATGLICLTGFYQAEVGVIGLSPFAAGLVAIAVEFGFIVLGLVQRVRAFLYVGTFTFVGQILWQLWRFGRDYSLLLWIFGIVVGLILIWVAATFEARKAQANALLQHWITELENWQ